MKHGGQGERERREGGKEKDVLADAAPSFMAPLLFLSFACPQRCNNSLGSQCHCDDKGEGEKKKLTTQHTHHLNCNGDGPTTANKRALNNEIHIKYKLDWGIVEPAVP